jgi:DNA-binding CsgD family transcriptional regulator
LKQLAGSGILEMPAIADGIVQKVPIRLGPLITRMQISSPYICRRGQYRRLPLFLLRTFTLARASSTAPDWATVYGDGAAARFGNVDQSTTPWGGGHMRAALLASNRDTSAFLAAAFDYVGLSLAVVHHVADIEYFTRHAQVGDVVVLDCARVVDDCCDVLRHTELQIIALFGADAPREQFALAARGPVLWLPAQTCWPDLLALLRKLKRSSLAYSARNGKKELSLQQLRVLELVAANRSQSEIAGELHVGIGTVKKHVERIKEELGVSTTMEMKLVFSWMTRPHGMAAGGVGRGIALQNGHPMANLEGELDDQSRLRMADLDDRQLPDRLLGSR